jgi:hypothetical protein
MAEFAQNRTRPTRVSTNLERNTTPLEISEVRAKPCRLGLKRALDDDISFHIQNTVMAVLISEIESYSENPVWSKYWKPLHQGNLWCDDQECHR